jgi:hypothetical protein
MKVRTYLLAGLALGMSADAVHAQRAQDPQGAPAVGQSAGSQTNSSPVAGNGGAPQSPGAGTPGNAIGAGGVKDLPAGAADSGKADGNRSAITDQSGPRSRTGVGTGTPDTAPERQPAIKPAPGDGAKEGILGSPLDTSITVSQGRRPASKDPNRMGLPGRALLGHLLNKSKPAIAPIVANRHDVRKPPQKLLGGGQVGGRQDAPMRNAIGAHIEHRILAHRGAAPPVGQSAVQSITPQGTSTPLSSAQAPAPAPGPIASVNQHQGVPPINHTDPPAHSPFTVPVSGPAINGTAMIRPSASTGAIGGSVKIVTGVLSGSNFRMRHP